MCKAHLASASVTEFVIFEAGIRFLVFTAWLTFSNIAAIIAAVLVGCAGGAGQGSAT